MVKRQIGGSKREWSLPAVLVNATRTPTLVTVPRRTALAVDGRGAPSSEVFVQSLEALYGVAYGVKFARKKFGRNMPFKVAALEGRWGAEGWTDTTQMPPRERWTWRLRMGLPADATQAEIDAVIRAASTKRGGKLAGNPMLGQLFIEQIPECRHGRILHVGPYADEPRSFVALAGVIAAAGLRAGDGHLEIYLGDPRRTAPEKLKTVLLKEIC